MKNLNVFKAFILRYSGLVLLLVSCSIVVTIVWKFIIPKVDEIKTLRNEIQIKTKERNDLSLYVDYLKELASSTLLVEEELVNYALPSENDVISLIVTYEGLSKDENVTVSPFDFSPGLIQQNNTESVPESIPDSGSTNPSDIKSELQSLNFSMNIETEKSETALAFINSIHQTRRFFSIKSLSWKNPDQQQSGKDPIKIQMSIETFYYDSPPHIVGSENLVIKGKTQSEFINKLNSTTVFDDLVLNDVPVGKEDFFVLDESVTIPNKIEEPIEVSSTESSTLL